MDIFINRNGNFSINSLRTSLPTALSHRPSYNLTFNNDRELTGYKIGQLQVNVSPLLTCAFCHEEMKTIDDSFHHTIKHFSFSKCEQSIVLKWLSELYNYNNSKEIEREVMKPVIEIYHSKSKVFELQQIRLEVPTVPTYLKCFICKKHFNHESISKHIFGHYNIPHSSQKNILIWFENFFKSKERKEIEEDYQQYLNRIKELPNSSALMKIVSLNESQTNICKNCNLVTLSSEELFAHYVECISLRENSFWNCVICNYQVPDSSKLIDHMWNTHIYCIFCKKIFLDFNFEECISHLSDCSKSKCPICFNGYKNKQILIKHLKGPEFMCPHCYIVLAELNEWRAHFKICDEKRVFGVRCPCCHIQEFSSKLELDNHILNCKPWLVKPNEPIALCKGIKKNSNLSFLAKKSISNE